MLQGREMAAALRSGATHLDNREQHDSADRCRAGADEIARLLDVIRSRDKHIEELQAQLIGPPGPYTIGEVVLMGDRTPEFESFINRGKAVLLIEMDRDDLRTCGAMLFKRVRVILEGRGFPAARHDGEETNA